MKALVKATTGASVLGTNQISVVKSDGSMAFFHTCSCQIDLPERSYAEYIAFKAMLNLSIE